MVARIFAPHPQTSHDAEAAKHHRLHRFYRFVEVATLMLHLISSIVVLVIVVYFLHGYRRGFISAPFWAALAVMDILVCLYALFRGLFRPGAGDVALAMFTLAGLWLAALAFALKDYRHSTCSEGGSFDDCSLRQSQIAFSLLAFLTSNFAMVLGITRWRQNRRQTLVDDKASQTSAPVATTTPFSVQTTTTPPRKTSLTPQNIPSPAKSTSLGPQNTPFPAT